MATRFMTRNIKWFIVSRLNIYLFQVRNAKSRIDNVNLIKRKKNRYLFDLKIERSKVNYIEYNEIY